MSGQQFRRIWREEEADGKDLKRKVFHVTFSTATSLSG
jgi:hypothetical protein